MINNSNKKLSYVKQTLIDNVKKVVQEKKDRLSVTSLHFEDEDISSLEGITRVGYYIHAKSELGTSNFKYWEDIPATLLVKMRDKLNRNRFYVEKRIEGTVMKIRLKKD